MALITRHTVGQDGFCRNKERHVELVVGYFVVRFNKLN